jgi:hypothetical protein
VFQAVDLSSLDASEEDKIQAMMTQSTQDYNPVKYVLMLMLEHSLKLVSYSEEIHFILKKSVRKVFETGLFTVLSHVLEDFEF